MKYNNNRNPLNHGQGNLDSPDFGDQTSSGTEFTTNIAISLEEAEQFETMCSALSTSVDRPTFNYRGQNCTSFVKHVLTELKLAELPASP